ncbi:unnamed protein product [Linum trigynum]|uniref:Secreted protein n=1 Tax=Linum trigynum TaxID=586398 RepID=A0AAV2GNS5_9ROSI
MHTSSHCIAVVSLWAINTEVRLLANDLSAVSISASVVLSSALVASSHSLTNQHKKHKLICSICQINENMNSANNKDIG